MVSPSTSGVCSQSNSTKKLCLNCREETQHLKTALNGCTCTGSDGTPSVGNESFKHDERESLLLTVNNCLLGRTSSNCC